MRQKNESKKRSKLIIGKVYQEYTGIGHIVHMEALVVGKTGAPEDYFGCVGRDARSVGWKAESNLVVFWDRAIEFGRHNREAFRSILAVVSLTKLGPRNFRDCMRLINPLNLQLY